MGTFLTRLDSAQVSDDGSIAYRTPPPNLPPCVQPGDPALLQWRSLRLLALKYFSDNTQDHYQYSLPALFPNIPLVSRNSAFPTPIIFDGAFRVQE